MSYAYFVTTARCPACHAESETSVHTKVEAEIGQIFRVGDRLEWTIKEMATSHYTVRLPAAGEPLHILEEWGCPRCQVGSWLEVVVAEQIIRSMEPVRLEPAVLDRVHFVGGLLDQVFEEVTGEPFHVDSEPRADWVTRLRAGLA